MELGDELSRVRALSDDALLLGLARSLRASRRSVAAIVAHLGEVEERRLHLLGGYASMFAYCVTRLGMSEDEAYRRREVARLVRRYPRLLEMLATGQVSLSVAALLKSRLTDENHEALLAAVSGKTVAQAREVLAAWFPRPDVMPLLRKLPARPAPAVPQAASPSAVCEPRPANVTESLESAPASVSERAPQIADATAAPTSPPAKPVPPAQSMPERPRPAPRLASAFRSLEPLSSDRYKLQLTATTDLKRKLDLARDLLRHAVPSGDLATLIERALDLLLEQTTKRRFARKLPEPTPPSPSQKLTEPALAAGTTQPIPGPVSTALTAKPALASAEPALSLAAERAPPEPALASAEPVLSLAAERAPPEPALASAEPASARPSHATHGVAPKAEVPSSAAPSSTSRHIPNEARRAVVERDGLRCTWQAPDGTRCNSQAWLEHDHIIPRGKGGTNEAINGRILCRPHNRLAAELAYGQSTITRIIARRRRQRAPTPPRPINDVQTKTPVPSR